MSTQSHSGGRLATAVRQMSLRTATALYCVGFLIHNADHARRSVAASPEPVVWAGTFVAMLTAVIVTLVVVGHRHAALSAAVGGAAIAIGVSVSHLLPKWGPLSDPLPGGRVDAFTWFAVLAEISCALILCLYGLSYKQRSTSPMFT
jgi:hypothetical protein